MHQISFRVQSVREPGQAMKALFRCCQCGDDNTSNDNNNKGLSFSELEEKKVVTTDNRSGLNVRQVFSLKQSWKGVMRDEVSFGVEMFVR